MTYFPIPDGHLALPLDSEEGLFSWPVALLGRVGAPGKFELVMLANLPDSRAYLGCLLDDQKMVREWLQIWVQDLAGLTELDLELAETLSNEQLDRRWHRRWLALRDLSPQQIVLEPEAKSSRPIFVDPQALKIVRPKTPEGLEWKLCRDDAELAAANLPRYSQSIWRYLKVQDATGGSKIFAASDSRAPSSDSVRERSSALGFKPEYIPVNPEGGQMGVRLHSALDLADYADLLGGATIAEIGTHKNDCEAAVLSGTLATLERDGRRHGLLFASNNATELFYLRLRLFLQAARSYLSYLRANQCPLLNLDAASFGVGIQTAGELPWAWTTHCELVRPGRAVKFSIPNTDQVRFISVGHSGMPAYCPSTSSRTGDHGAIIRPVRINVDENRLTFEGNLWLASPVQVETSDVLRFRLTQAGISGDFFAAVVVDKPGVYQEILFRTWHREMSANEIAQLKRHEGGKLARSWCELIPVLSSPYDFYSLSVVGARALLVNAGNDLSKVVDELERLGRTAGKQLAPLATHAEIVAVVEKLLSGGAGGDALGMTQIFGQVSDRSRQPGALPSPMWAEAIAILLRLMPGLGNASLCADYGAAPAGGLHVPLQEPVAALENLCARARALVVSDWNANRELRSILAEMKNSM